MQDQQQAVGPGKRVHRISVFCIPYSSTTDCMIYTTKADSLEIHSTYGCLTDQQYKHLASVVNEAARRGYGEVEAHGAIPGFIWHRPAYGPEPYIPSPYARTPPRSSDPGQVRATQ